MPRATRYLHNGFVYHLTHRCLDGEFFLRFVKERDAYREWLRIGARRHQVPVLGYAITSNHVHVVSEVRDRHAVADMMKLAAGAVAQARNRRKGREGSAWEHPYHCTKIQDGRHLLNCLRYVDLNMVRAGKVRHPQDWRWCSYDELTGKRKRYRIVDQERLLALTGFPTMAEFAEQHARRIEERLAQGKQDREPHWTDAVAIGDRAFVELAEQTLSCRRSMDYQQLTGPENERAWIARESSSSYGSGKGRKQPL